MICKCTNIPIRIMYRKPQTCTNKTKELCQIPHYQGSHLLQYIAAKHFPVSNLAPFTCYFSDHPPRNFHSTNLPKKLFHSSYLKQLVMGVFLGQSL